MPLKKDHSSKKTVSQVKKQAVDPDESPRFAPLLAEAWAAEAATGDREMAVEGTVVRHSWAGMCARRIAYGISGYEETDPPDLAAYWRFGLGTAVHDMWQPIFVKVFGETADVEVKCQSNDLLTSGHADAFVLVDDKRVVLELKTINGWGFKSSVGARGPAEGPKYASIVQAALNAHTLDADEMVVVLLSLENLSAREMDRLGWVESWRKFCAEWTYGREEIDVIATAELTRLGEIVGLAADGVLAPRSIPDPQLPPGAIVTNPVKGAWEVRDGEIILDVGVTWHCNYCPMQRQCCDDAAAGQ